MHKVTPTKMIELMIPIYKSGKKVPAIMLWGQPGIGKSQGVRRMAEKLHKETGREVNVVDVRLLLYNPVDLRGIPVPDAERESAKWLKPEIFKLDADPNKLHILLLDELSSAPPSVQAAAYQLILDRKIGEHSLPDNVILIGAGNRVEDKGVAYKMPTPLANRMSHFEVVSDFQDWKEWAIDKGIHPMVIGFLNFKESYLNKFDPSSNLTTFPTPRTWEFVSDYLHILDGIEEASPLIASTIGEGYAVELKAFAKTYKDLPNFNHIMDGQEVKLKSKSPDVMCALSSMIVTKAGKMTKDQLRNVFHFMLDSKIPNEYVIMTIKDLFNIPSVLDHLKKFNRFAEWFVRNEMYLN